MKDVAEQQCFLSLSVLHLTFSLCLVMHKDLDINGLFSVGRFRVYAAKARHSTRMYVLQHLTLQKKQKPKSTLDALLCLVPLQYKNHNLNKCESLLHACIFNMQEGEMHIMFNFMI